MNLREVINAVVFKKRKYELIKNNFVTQHFPESEFKFKVDYIINHRIMNTNNFFFIQVGANDGITGDSIYNLLNNDKASGLLLEPIPYYFNKLRKNYMGRENITLINMALHPTESEKTMYKIDENALEKKGVPVWAGGITTFSKEKIEMNCRETPILEKYLKTEKVKCTTFEKIIDQNHISKIDLLLIDTEGFDYEVIKMIDFNKIKPSIIRFEHNILSKKDLHSCLELLVSVGYKLFYEQRDITACYKTNNSLSENN